MTKLAPALTALFLLAACGGGAGENQAAADNSAATAGTTDTLTLPPDESAGNVSAVDGDTLANQANALESANVLGNEVSANAIENSASGSALNAAGNAQ